MSAELYTASRLRVLRECPRKHHLRYRLGLLVAETAEMRFGTVGHRALEAWYRAWQEHGREYDDPAVQAEADEVRAGVQLLAALRVVRDADLNEFEEAKLRLLVIAYHERWKDEPWTVEAVEVEFRYLLGDYLIGGKIDALIRSRADGRVYVVEHKFTGSDTSLGGPYWERLALDTQVSIYIDGAAMLGYDVAGCIYDVIKRPEHEQRAATPPAARRYTVGKGCKACGGSAKAGAVEQGRGYIDVVFASEVKRNTCDGCAGTGWKLDKDGKPEAPRLHSTQREHDETLEEFEERLLDVIAERPDDFLQRGPVVRIGDELPAMRIDLIEWIELERTGLAPRNDSACARAGRICSFFDVCTGRAAADNFPRGPAHPELDAAA